MSRKTNSVHLRILLALCVSVSLWLSISMQNAEATTTLKAMRYDAKRQSTRMVLVFDQQASYEQITRTMLIELRFSDLTVGDFVRPRMSPSDRILKDFTFNQTKVEGVVSLILILHKRTTPSLFWLDSPPRLVIDLKPALGTPTPAEPTSTPAIEGAGERGSYGDSTVLRQPHRVGSVSEASGQVAATHEPELEETGFETLQEFEALSLQPERVSLPNQIPERSALNPLVDAPQQQRIPVDAIDNARIVQTELPAPAPAVQATSSSAWARLRSVNGVSWKHIQLALDVVLIATVVLLWLRLRQVNRKLGELAVKTPKAQHFDAVLAETVKATQETPSAFSHQPSATSRQPERFLPKTRSWKLEADGLAKRQASSVKRHSAIRNPKSEGEEETVIEDDKSLKSVVRRMAKQGMSEAQIAMQLGLPREEIALLLSIKDGLRSQRRVADEGGRRLSRHGL